MAEYDRRAAAPHMRELVSARLSRRTVLGAIASAPLLSTADAATGALAAGPAPSFASVPATIADQITVPTGYRTQTLIAWGDALFDGMAPFDPEMLTRADQERRFGQNNDMLALIPREFAFPWRRDERRFFLCSNHEYVEPALMYPGLTRPTDITPAHVQAMFAAMGLGVVQVEHDGAGRWRVVREPAPGRYNRRVTPFSPVIFEGPAKDHPWVAAAGAIFNAAESGAPSGAVACGTLANCAGGVTPWGTYLSAEENFNLYFYNSNPSAAPLKARAAEGAYVLDSATFGYGLTSRTPPVSPPQFDLAANPTGPACYGWTVELDPSDPDWTPRKRTALGRRKGECATTALARDGRVVVYSGDDQIDEYVYKFVSRGRFNPADRKANRTLLDDGQLYAARFEEDGSGRWLAITLANANRAARDAGYPHRFVDEGDLMIRAREAARLLGATPMDRPEDVEAMRDDAWRGLGPVFVVCTKNPYLGFEHPGNPRRHDPEKPHGAQANQAGHILRIDEASNDCGARRFRWNVFVLGGDPKSETGVARMASGARGVISTKLGDVQTASGDRFACPDNICFDSALNVWIATDGSDAVFADCNDSVLVAPATGTGPRPMKRFLVGPMGAEICGPTLAPDESAFLCAVRHPGENDASGTPISELRWNRGQRPPSTFPDGGWPRSAVVVVTRIDGGKVGT